MRYCFKLIILCYRYCLSPLLGQHCRFVPSCSEYALEALNKYSLRKSLFLIIKRIIKCGPWNPGGHDPVP